MSDTDRPRRRPWHEVDAGRVAWEIDQFQARELPVAHAVGGSDGRHLGQFTVRTALPFRGEKVALEVVYPFDFPDAAPTVYGPGGLVDRHQTRTGGNFCLLEDPDADWWPGWSGAELVDVTLRALLEDAEAGTERVAAGEADMPEPVSAHVSYRPGWAVLVPDPFWALEVPATYGDLTLVDGVFSDQFVLASADGFGETEAALVSFMAKTKAKAQRGVWVALPDTPSPYPEPSDLLEAAEGACSGLFQRPQRMIRAERKRKTAGTWVGLTFREEGPERGQSRRAWIFARVALDRNGERRIEQLVQAQALTRDERARRLPELRGLDRARIAVIGAGSLGAPVAFELAKAGVGHLDIVDYDAFDVNNAVRHVLDSRWAGSQKALAVSIEARRRNPFGTIHPVPGRVGGGQEDSDLMDQLLQQADLVVDTTGSQAVARILDRRCREHRRRLVVAGLTAGSFGGEIVVLRPDGPCFYCFALFQADGSIPKPNAGPRSNVTPIGCSHPAFSGAGFEATELAATAARVAVQATYLTRYPPLEYDWAVINFRGTPRWRSDTLEHHPSCPRCG